MPRSGCLRTSPLQVNDPALERHHHGFSPSGNTELLEDPF
jgi:hypothetical protein